MNGRKRGAPGEEEEEIVLGEKEGWGGPSKVHHMCEKMRASTTGLDACRFRNQEFPTLPIIKWENVRF
jgi:hypothetical protein